MRKVWSENTQKKQVKNTWSTINHAWFEMAARKNTFLTEHKTTPACLINRINNIELPVDWWSLQSDYVTWRQARSQLQARTWGTLSKLQTGDSFICNTEEPVYSRVHRHHTWVNTSWHRSRWSQLIQRCSTSTMSMDMCKMTVSFVAKNMN